MTRSLRSRYSLLLAAGLFTVLAVPLAASAAAADFAIYHDDRSTAESLIKSLYNAIDRKEYARAYSYFAAEAVPDFDTFSAGYEDTQFVELVHGDAVPDGTAGSTFYGLPVAIRSHLADGSRKTFAGCYTLRLINPSIQSPPFRPLFIVSGSLAPKGNSGTLASKLPQSCTS